MIKFVKGNIFDCDAQALVNTVNTVGVMGKGLALQFREKYPENYKIYRKVCKENGLSVGQMLVTEEVDSDMTSRYIINFPTKTHWKYPSEYSYIEKGLAVLRGEIIDRKIHSIAIPALGSHNGGLDWNIVKPMIESALTDLDCNIYVYEPSEEIKEIMKSERLKLTPARAMLLLMFADMFRYGEFASVFAAEKLVYFLQRFGARDIFNIEFKPYIYGPYSGGKVAHVLYYLNGSYITGMTAMQNRPFDFIWLTDKAGEEARKYLETECDGRLLEICNKTSQYLHGFYGNYSLELISTVDYILCNAPDSLQNWKTSDESQVISALQNEIQKWSQRKEHIFKPEYVSIAFRHIKENCA